MNGNKQIQKQLDQYGNLQQQADKICSERFDNIGLNVNVVNSKNTIKEVEVGEDTHKEEQIDSRKCELDEKLDTSDINYTSVNQYRFSSIEAVDKSRKRNCTLLDFKVKAKGYYNYWDKKKEDDASERNEEEKIMLVMRKEPKPPWKITMLTEQDDYCKRMLNTSGQKSVSQ